MVDLTPGLKFALVAALQLREEMVEGRDDIAGQEGVRAAADRGCTPFGRSMCIRSSLKSAPSEFDR